MFLKWNLLLKEMVRPHCKPWMPSFVAAQGSVGTDKNNKLAVGWYNLWKMLRPEAAQENIDGERTQQLHGNSSNISTRLQATRQKFLQNGKIAREQETNLIPRSHYPCCIHKKQIDGLQIKQKLWDKLSQTFVRFDKIWVSMVWLHWKMELNLLRPNGDSMSWLCILLLPTSNLPNFN